MHGAIIPFITFCDLNSHFLCGLSKNMRPKKSGKPLITLRRTLADLVANHPKLVDVGFGQA